MRSAAIEPQRHLLPQTIVAARQVERAAREDRGPRRLRNATHYLVVAQTLQILDPRPAHRAVRLSVTSIGNFE